MRISMIAALGERNRVIGKNNDLPWSRRLRPDMDRFVRITRGHPVIMGRKTWESIPSKFRPLTGRTNIILSRSNNLSVHSPGVYVTPSLGSAIEIAHLARGNDEVFIIGGGRIYRDGLLFAQRLYLTLVDEDAEGDTFFPDYAEFRKEIEREVVPDFTPRLTFITLERM